VYKYSGYHRIAYPPKWGTALISVPVNGRFGVNQLSHRYVSKNPTPSIFMDMKDLVTLKLNAVGTSETSEVN